MVNKDYEIALSYAHKDMEIAEVIKKELKNVFAGGFFMDMHNPEELADATGFKEKLRDIFSRSNYSIILYSPNYDKGKFTLVERDAILEKIKNENPPHLFIINIDNCEVCKELDGFTFILLETFGYLENKTKQKYEKLQKDVHYIVHNRIKMRMIKRTINEKKMQKEFSLNVQTSFVDNNTAKWKTDYDWNLLGKAFIGEDGKRISEKYEWTDLWEYVRGDFNFIKDILEEESETLFRLRLNCHLSIAYKLGKTYGDLWQASGNRNLVLVSSNRVKDIEFPFEKEVNCTLPDDFCKIHEGNNCQNPDIVCIISIKPYEQSDVLATVKEFLYKNNLQYKKICLFKKEMTIENTNELEGMAKYLREKMRECRTGSNCTIHLFPDTAAPLMFTLAAKTMFPGKVKLYEYYRDIDSYEFSLEG